MLAAAEAARPAQVLSQRRIQRLAGKPLVHTEFVQPLAKIDPVVRDEFDQLAVSPPAPRCMRTAPRFPGSCGRPFGWRGGEPQALSLP